MGQKRVLYGKELREKLLAGVNLMAGVVGSTLGPRGRNVIIGQRHMGRTPRTTKDGVTAANWTDANDHFEQLGADLVREASQKTMSEVGDGTTTAMVLSQEMVRLGFQALERGAAPFVVRRGMERMLEVMIEEIKSHAIPVEAGRLVEVARLAANGDAEIAQLVAEASGRSGADGVVTIDDSQNGKSSLEMVPGLQIPSGYASEAFITNFETRKCEFDKPAVLLWEGKIGSARALGHLLSQAAEAGIPLVVVAGDFAEEALALLVTNRLKVQSVAVKIPIYGDRRREVLRDIGALTGATAFTDDLGQKLESVRLDSIGQAKRVTVDAKRTVIVGGDNHQAMVVGRRLAVKAAMEKASPEEKPYLEGRLAGLTGGVAVLRIGAVTETALKEKRDRAEDAMYAAREALKSGIVAGGGLTLLRASKVYFPLVESLSPDERTGAEIVRRAAWKPLERIAANAGENGLSIALRVMGIDQDGSLWNVGYNARTAEIEDLVEAGIVDPASVVMETLRNAVAVAAELICTEVAVVDVGDPDARTAV